MTDQPTVPPPPAPRPEDDPVWRRLVTDCAAFPHQYPMPAHLAELVRQTAWLAFVRGMRYQQQTPTWTNRPPTPEWIVADVLNHAATHDTDRRMAAPAALAHAGQRARAHVATAAGGDETTTGNCDG